MRRAELRNAAGKRPVSLDSQPMAARVASWKTGKSFQFAVNGLLSRSTYLGRSGKNSPSAKALA
jgi:hypothetical protein